MNNLISFLNNRLSKHLPGKPSQLKMAPKPVNGGKSREMQAPDHAHRSSVIILLFPNSDEEWELTLTLRSKDIDHGGQISFPGGRSEPGEDAIQTALREAQEEIGTDPRSISIIGQLSELYISNSDNIVTPVVGHVEARPDFTVNPDEVEEVFTVELDSLIHKKNLTIENWDFKNHTFRVPYWDVHRVPLWGATAMMLSEFLDLYREFREVGC